jgi:uncharacterized protein
MANTIVWADIPVTDMARAKAFYDAILGGGLAEMPGSAGHVVLLSTDPEGVGGDLVQGEGQVPGPQGCTVYLNGGDDLAVILERVEPAGGTVLMPKTDMGEMVGHIAFFLDTEGNRLGLHSVG